jgi:biopolymer transport protein ExbD
MRALAVGLALLVVAMAACRPRSNDAVSTAAVDASTPSPPAVLATPTSSEPLTVVVTRTQLIADDAVVAMLPATREQAATGGFDAKYKNAAAELAPLAKVAGDRRARDEDAGHTTEAILIADPSTTYRIFSEVITTFTRAGVGKYHLMILVKAGADAGKPPALSHEVPAAPISLPPRAPGTPLRLSAHIEEQGVTLRTSDGALGKGCTPNAAGVTVPKVRGQHDLAALRRCAVALAATAPGETGVSIGAEASVDYGSVIAVMDALGKDDTGAELFASVVFEPVR